MMLNRTLAEAVIWICTRDNEAIKEIENVRASAQLIVALVRYRAETTLPRWRHRTEDAEVAPIGTSTHYSEYSSQSALSALTLAVTQGKLAVYVETGSGQRPLQFPELADLELRISDQQHISCALWNRTLEQFVYPEPTFSQDDLERIWPAPRVPTTTRTTNKILDALMAATTDGAIKKEAALALARAIPGFGQRRFEDAWRQLPVDRKFGRGQRGPNKIAA